MMELGRGFYGDRWSEVVRCRPSSGDSDWRIGGESAEQWERKGPRMALRPKSVSEWMGCHLLKCGCCKGAGPGKKNTVFV